MPTEIMSGCTGVRGAECWTDHRLVRARLRLNNIKRNRALVGFTGTHTRQPKPSMSQLMNESVQESFDNKLMRSLETSWEMCTTVHEKWDLLVRTVQTAVKETIPVSTMKSADWLLENETMVRQAWEKCNCLKSSWFSTKSEADRECA